MIQAELMMQEFVRVLSFDAVGRQDALWKILQIESNNCVAMGVNRGRKNVTIVFIW
jgi:hypothetical protein